MKSILTLALCTLALWAQAQTGSLIGQLQDPDGAALAYANIALYRTADSSLAKVEASDESGRFTVKGLPFGEYYLVASYVGVGELRRDGLTIQSSDPLDLGVLAFQSAAIELEGATVTARRTMVEIRPDKTVFNVDGTINSTGDDAMSLMRKAPGVLVDNNDNIIVMGRSGVQVFVDGKRIPLSGEDLTDYLKNIPSDQIDRIDIITNPGAKYEAEGNAGIIDIRLKKDKNLGANGSVRGTVTQGVLNRRNGGATANYRNKLLNVFANVGGYGGRNFNTIRFDNFQNGLAMTETNRFERDGTNYNYRTGVDFYLGEKHTLGVLLSGNVNDGINNVDNRIGIATIDGPIDSVLIASGNTDQNRKALQYNLNYRYEDKKKGQSFNLDADYGQFRNDISRYQPNRYYTPDESTLLTEIINLFYTPSDIDIYTFKADYEQQLRDGGKLSLGTKFSQVVSDNTFLVYDRLNDIDYRNDTLSNRFRYDEAVYAAYVNYVQSLGDKWGLSAGFRAELTDVRGDLQAFLPALQEPPVEQLYMRYFPSVGLTYKASAMHNWAFNYGRRINRPDYNVLNPFNNRLSQISSEQGNPNLSPEIVNNIEVGYTYRYIFNFKLAYSKTLDQITRLIAPDDRDPRANYITWENLASQRVISFNASAPVQFTKKWNAYMNFNASHIDNQAEYPDGGVVDVQAFTYNVYMQHTFTLPHGFKGEVSGYYSGPGVWGGVFLYDANWSLNLGLQRRFLNDQLNVRLTANDLFYQTGWTGRSSFNGLVATGAGNWDSRYVSLSIGYNFGNQNIKTRKRTTGLEDEARRISE